MHAGHHQRNAVAQADGSAVAIIIIVIIIVSFTISMFDDWSLQVSVTGEGAFIMQLSAQNGAETGMKLYDGWQDQSVSCLTDLTQTDNDLVCVGLYDLSSNCKTFNSGERPQKP